MNNWLAFAYKKTKESKHPAHQMSAVLINGGRLISYGVNLGSWNRHAEVRCIRPHRDYTGCTLIVVRSNKGCSKPCPNCMSAIIKSGINKVVYVGKSGQLEEMKI